MSVHPLFSDSEDGIPSYMGRLTQSPLLTQEQELTLTAAVQRGDPVARGRLIESNMRLVINIAKTYRNRTVPLEDLIQEGAIGLIQAAERFDPNKGFRFSTYATHWIRQSIGRAIDNKSKAIRIPAHVSQSLRKVERERIRLAGELGHEPTFEQVAAAIGLSPKRLMNMVQTNQELLSLDMAIGDGNGMTLGGMIRDDSIADPEAKVLEQEVVLELARILSELNEREQRVMHLRYRGDGTDSSVHDDVAKELSLSRERVRQIEVQAIKKLRVIAHRRRLKDLVGE